MKLLLLCLGLTLVCATHEGEMDVVEDFDPSKITGKWFNVLLASNQKEKIEENSSLRVFRKCIDLLKNSSLLLKFHATINGQCTEVFLTCNRTDKDGIYTANYGGPLVFSIADVEYDEYLLFFVKIENNLLVAELYGRQPDVRTKIREKFVEFCKKHGIAKENIVDMTKVDDPCLQSRSDEDA